MPLDPLDMEPDRACETVVPLLRHYSHFQEVILRGPLALERPECTVLLDDRQARRIAASAGLAVRGTLGVLIEAKARGLTERIEPFVDRLENSGMWMTDAIRDRVLALAGEERTET